MKLLKKAIAGTTLAVMAMGMFSGVFAQTTQSITSDPNENLLTLPGGNNQNASQWTNTTNNDNSALTPTSSETQYEVGDDSLNTVYEENADGTTTVFDPYDYCLAEIDDRDNATTEAAKLTTQDALDTCIENARNASSNSSSSNSSRTMGIGCDTDDLIHGSCELRIYETLGIRKSNQDPSVSLFVQDIVLSATFFIGTVVTVALITAGIFMIMGGVQGNDDMARRGKDGIKWAVIGLLLVTFSYAIIRLVQFIARG